MRNPFDDIRAAVQQAKDLNRAVDQQSHNLALLLKGRLRQVPEWTLKELKRELQAFNVEVA